MTAIMYRTSLNIKNKNKKIKRKKKQIGSVDQTVKLFILKTTYSANTSIFVAYLINLRYIMAAILDSLESHQIWVSCL